MLTSQAQQTVLDISSYLIDILSITGDVCHKMLRLKTYSDTIKKHLSGILDYSEVEFIHPPLLEQFASIAYISK